MINFIKENWRGLLLILALIAMVMLSSESSAQDLVIKADSTRTGFLDDKQKEQLLPYEAIKGSISLDGNFVDISVNKGNNRFFIFDTKAFSDSGIKCFTLFLVSEDGEGEAILFLCRHREDVVLLFDDNTIYSFKVSEFSNPNATQSRSSF